MKIVPCFRSWRLRVRPCWSWTWRFTATPRRAPATLTCRVSTPASTSSWGVFAASSWWDSSMIYWSVSHVGISCRYLMSVSSFGILCYQRDMEQIKKYKIPSNKKSHVTNEIWNKQKNTKSLVIRIWTVQYLMSPTKYGTGKKTKKIQNP